MTSQRRRNRRQFLAGMTAIGGAAVAGCVELPWRETDASPAFTAADAQTVLTETAPGVRWPVPVVPDPGAVDDGLARVETLLEGVPDPLDADTVPNGVVRQSISDRRDSARGYRDEASVAEGDDLYHAVRTTRDARESARAAAATFAAIDDESLVDDLEAERADVRSAVAEKRDAIAYEGGDDIDERLRAALFYGRLESDLDRAQDQVNRWPATGTDTVVDIGGAAGHLEFAAATATVWEHLSERYDAGLEASVDLTADFESALEATVDRAAASEFRERDDDWFEHVRPADLDERVLENLLFMVGRPVVSARDQLTEAAADGELGTGLYHAVRFEVTARAFERVRERLEDGTLAEPEDVADVRAERVAAIEAAETTLEEVTGPSPGTYVLGETLQSLAWTDETVRRAAEYDPDTTVSLLSEFEDYVRLRAHLEALPAGVDAFRDRLLDR